jgi:hypothetical protein
MSEIAASRRALVMRLLEGDGRAAKDVRRAAFDARDLAEPIGALVHKVGIRPTEIHDEDIAAARGAGLTEDQLFEVVVCAAVGHAIRQHDAALAAVDAALAAVDVLSMQGE